MGENPAHATVGEPKYVDEAKDEDIVAGALPQLDMNGALRKVTTRLALLHVRVAKGAEQPPHRVIHVKCVRHRQDCAVEEGMWPVEETDR